MMRIAFDDQTFTQQTHGGISRYFCRLVEALNAVGCEAKIFAPLHINSYIESLPEGVVWGRRLSRYPYRTARFFTSFNHLVSLRAIAAWRPQLVHETYFSKTGSGPKGCPVVVTVYDMIHERFANEFSTRVDTRGAKRAAVHRADHVICISENTRRDLMEITGVPEQKISVIHLACDPAPAQSLSDDHSVAHSKPYLLFVGARSGYKNFNRLLQTMAASSRLMRDFELLAFGGGPFSTAELAMMQSLGFQTGQIRQFGGDDKVLSSLYRGAAAFVYPSIYEGFGIPPLEAMAHGCPVVCSNASSMPEVVADAGAYFDPLDSAQMAAAIESVVYGPTLASHLRLKGHHRVAQFSWTRCAAETSAVYRSLI
jgi:glycosyltransferase involved in cell wall biosynthesis